MSDELGRLRKIERNNSVLFDKWKAAEERARRLEDGLRDLRVEAAPREWETPGHPMNDWTKREPILRKIDALLSASPSDEPIDGETWGLMQGGGGAK